MHLPPFLATRLARPLLLCLLLVAGCASVHGASRGKVEVGMTEKGVASWYGPGFHGRQTASGERYDQDRISAAHPTLPFGTLIRVENLDNGKTLEMAINDRGPFAKRRILDLSKGAAQRLGVIGPGTANIRLKVLELPESWGYAVQIGAFRKQRNAQRTLERVRQTGDGFPQVDIHHDGGWYRVQARGFESRKEARRLRNTLRRFGFSAVLLDR